MSASGCQGREGDSRCYVRTPVAVTAAFVDLLRTYFGSVHRSCLERGDFLWNEDPNVSHLYIADEFNWDLANVGSRPALVVEVGDVESHGSASTIGRSGLSGMTPSGGFRISHLDRYSVTVQCIARNKLECWSLAWETKTFLQSFAHEIGRAYRFSDLRVLGVRKPAPVQSDANKGYMSSSVGVSFNVSTTSSVETESLPATNFGLDVKPS